jgi:hypothetical protein
MLPKQLSFAKFATESDTFQSHQGNTIQLGHRNRIAPTNSYQRCDFLRHSDGPHTVSHSDLNFQTKKGLYSPTKRPMTSIENPRSLENKQHQEFCERRQQIQSTQRSSQLLQQNQRTGFNLLTGEVIGNGPKEVRNHLKYLPNGLGSESHHRGLQIMRESESRFFTPQLSGNGQSYRQQVLVSEGLTHPKQTKILRQGCRESLASYGVEDQFSKSQYVPRGMDINSNSQSRNQQCQGQLQQRGQGKGQSEGLVGLVEASQPGKYSPRKQGSGNPSGNPQVLSLLFLLPLFLHRSVRHGPQECRSANRSCSGCFCRGDGDRRGRWLYKELKIN